ncbi:hypothetical protein PV327_008761 [Microctonus hyperodae]|uniref:Uncharacterized protein n=1 Tax=Microctonus hyperodae TaxID=165561 RepID=A0AA39FSE8_MICHY|nr:hypothetical protein PV327_008761 [Microctonus hyperodae]
MSTISNDGECLQEELDENKGDDVVNETTGTTTPLSSSSGILDENLFDNMSESKSMEIQRSLLLQQLKDLEIRKFALKKKEESQLPPIDEAIRPQKPRWNKKGELNFFSSDEEEKIEEPKDDKKPLKLKDVINQAPVVNVLGCAEAVALQSELRSCRPPLKSSNNSTPIVKENKKLSSGEEAMKLIKEIRERSPPRIEVGPTTRVTMAQIHAENLKRGRIPKEQKQPEMLKGANRPRLTTDDPNARLAPSTAVQPAPYSPPTFEEVLKELGLEQNVQGQSQKPLYYEDCRMFSEDAFKDTIKKRSEMFSARMDSQTVSVGTQTYVTFAGKPKVYGCVNCRSAAHHARDCKLPYRPGFCQVCFADGCDTKDCIYPHGVEHEAALGLCIGCGRNLSLYCPECPDCNIRFEGIVDWLRLNYATWPSWAIPADHSYMVNEGKEMLKRRTKAKFHNPSDTPNRVREFLIRENALANAPEVASRHVPTAGQLSEKKRQLAIRALEHPLSKKTLDEIMKERPELDNGEEIKIVVPTKYKHYRAENK